MQFWKMPKQPPEWRCPMHGFFHRVQTVRCRPNLHPARPFRHFESVLAERKEGLREHELAQALRVQPEKYSAPFLRKCFPTQKDTAYTLPKQHAVDCSVWHWLRYIPLWQLTNLSCVLQLQGIRHRELCYPDRFAEPAVHNC